MTRQEVQHFIKGQLKKLQEAHVVDLMKACRNEELEEILYELDLDFSIVDEFLQEGKSIYQTGQEIPSEFAYELVWYIQQSGLEDDDFFEDYYDFVTILEDLGAKHIASIIVIKDLTDCEIEELLG